MDEINPDLSNLPIFLGGVGEFYFYFVLGLNILGAVILMTY